MHIGSSPVGATMKLNDEVWQIERHKLIPNGLHKWKGIVTKIETNYIEVKWNREPVDWLEDLRREMKKNSSNNFDSTILNGQKIIFLQTDQLMLKKEMKKLLWLDDIRDPFATLEGGGTWLVFSPIDLIETEVVWVKSYHEFVEWIISNGLPEGICFDHDLGMQVALKARAKGMSKRKSRALKKEEKTGYDCAKWLVEYCLDNKLRLPKYNIQSANSVGKDNIDGLFKCFIKNVNE